MAQIETIQSTTPDPTGIAHLMETFQTDPAGFSPKELFRLGCVLHQLDAMQAEEVKHDVQSAYHQLLQTLPQRTRLFDVLHEGLDRLLQSSSSSSSSSSEGDILRGMEAMNSLYRFSVLSEASHKCTAQSVSSLADYYSKVSRQKQASSSSILAILSLLFRLLWKSPSHVSLEWEELLPVLEILQEKNVWKPLAAYLDEVHFGWQDVWLEGYTDETQREYLTSWLESAAASPQDEEAAKLAEAIARAQPSPKTRPKRLSSAGSTLDPVQRQLDLVRAVFPQYGEGLVELALSLRQGNVEETVALLSSPTTEWPSSLRTVDPSLPRRHQKRVATQDADANQRTKDAIRAADEQEEMEAMVLTQFSTTGDEYDDDYDDQWDGVDTAGANDGGLYDDYQAVRTYNRVVREQEQEAAFWEDNANTNKKGTKASSGESKYRGPDKIKGGRIPKPPPGGSGNNSKTRDAAEDAKTNDPKTKTGEKQGGKQDAKPSRAAQRQKDRKMANRKEKQRQAMNKRGGS